MRFVRAKDKRVVSADFRSAILVPNSTLTRNNQIEFPLGRVRVVRKIWFSGRHAIPFQIEWVTFGQIERGRLASQRFGNSLEGHGIFSCWRLPRLFIDLVNVYFAHRRSEEHTSELQSPCNLVCRLLLEKK